MSAWYNGGTEQVTPATRQRPGAVPDTRCGGIEMADSIAAFPERVARGDFYGRAQASTPTHAGRWRFDGDHSGGVQTRCGRVLHAPVEFAPEAGVTCRQFLRGEDEPTDGRVTR